MKLETASELLRPGRASESPRSWLFASGLIFSALFWLLAWYGNTVQSMVAIWERSETFAHGFAIVPISAWLIWRRRHAVAALDLRPGFLALPLLALAGFGWLLGQLAGAGVVQQYALVIMIPLLVWAILGNEVVRALFFPLSFLLLAVPFGEFLLPAMIEHTADFTVFALKLSGIPVYREGAFLTIPSGNWSVVEACSGLRYIIASLTAGLLYAYITYRSLARRVLFVVASVVVPIVANWLRAYMIVMIGHLSGMKYAIGIDHLIYGWLFFGFVMMLLFWIGSRWREDIVTHQLVPDPVGLVKRDQPSMMAIMVATLAAAALVVIWPIAAARLDGAGPDPQLAIDLQPAGGWEPVVDRLTDWTPRFLNPQAQLKQIYAKDAQRVGLYIAYYRNQQEGSQLISSKNAFVDSTNSEWGNIGETQRILVAGNERISLIEARLRSRSAQLLVWRWYWMDGQYVMNPYWAKLLQAKSRLLGRGGDGAVVIVYTEVDADRKMAADRLQDFVNSTLPVITRSLIHAR